MDTTAYIVTANVALASYLSQNPMIANPDLTMSADEIRTADWSATELRWLASPYGEEVKPAAPPRVIYPAVKLNIPSDTIAVAR